MLVKILTFYVIQHKKNLENQCSASNRRQKLSVEKRNNILTLVKISTFYIIRHQEFWKINVWRRWINVKIWSVEKCKNILTLIEKSFKILMFYAFGIVKVLENQCSASNQRQNLSVQKRKNILTLVKIASKFRCFTLFSIERILENQRSASNRRQHFIVEKHKNILTLVKKVSRFWRLRYSASKESWKINVRCRIHVKN